MTPYKYVFLGGAAFFLAGLTHAAQVVVTTRGFITDSWDMTGTVFGAGPGYGTVTGKTVTQEYTFDDGTPPAVLEGDPVEARYWIPFSPTTLAASWINVRTTVDGIEMQGPLSETPGPNAFSNVDGISIIDGYKRDESNASGARDYLRIDQGSSNKAVVAGGNFYTNSQAVLTIEQGGNFLEGLGLSQQFTLDIQQEYFFSYGSAGWGTVLVSSDGVSKTLSSGYLNYLVQEATYMPVSDVPEPSSWAYLLAGGAVMSAWLRSRAT